MGQIHQIAIQPILSLPIQGGTALSYASSLLICFSGAPLLDHSFAGQPHTQGPSLVWPDPCNAVWAGAPPSGPCPCPACLGGDWNLTRSVS